MCVIIHRPKNSEIPLETLEQCWASNGDGAGILFVTDPFNDPFNRQLIIKKGLMTFNEFYEQYNKYKNNELLIHFRLASAGRICKELTHPFYINQNIAVMHNGHLCSEMINGLIKNDPELSDTKVYVDKILKLLPDGFLNNEGIVNLINDSLGRSIMVFLDSSGKITILGDQSESVIEDGVWYSNSWWRSDDKDFICVDKNIIEDIGVRPTESKTDRSYEIRNLSIPIFS